MSWKDYFYFQQKDRMAVILLLVLLCTSSAVYLLITHDITQDLSDNKAVEKVELESFVKEIEEARIENTPYPIKLKANEVVNINHADTLTLQRIPGIGATYARRIVSYREQNGKYTNIEDLKKIKGLKGKRFEKIRKYVCIEDQ